MSTRRERHALLRDHATAMQQEGQGVWNVEIIYPRERLRMVKAAIAGDRKWRGVVEQLGRIMDAQPPTICLFCPTDFSRSRMPELLVLVSPNIPDPENLLLNAVCKRCAARYATTEALHTALIAAYRENLISDARKIDVHPHGGQA